MISLDRIDHAAASLGATVTRMQPRIGAEIGGVDLRPPLTSALRDFLLAAVVKYRVIFFRNQDMTQAQHVALGRMFGDLEIHPMTENIKPTPENPHPEIGRIRTSSADQPRTDIWHTDTSFRPRPPMGAILRAIAVPEIGCDTLWSCAVSAYKGLSDGMKRRIETLKAEHDPLLAFGPFLQDNPEERARIARDHAPQSHPIVRIHPDTGERMLFVNANFTTRIVSLEPEESEALLKKLYSEFYRPDYQVRFKWRPNSVAFWERSTQHYAVRDFEGPGERIVDRVTIVGDAPVGPSQVRDRVAA
jgi:taurine dioxygenase